MNKTEYIDTLIDFDYNYFNNLNFFNKRRCMKKGLKILNIITCIVAIACSIITIFTTSLNFSYDDNITSYKATLNHISALHNDSNDSYLIYTNEYESKLLIGNKNMILDFTKFEVYLLENNFDNVEIEFSLQGDSKDDLNTDTIIEIISLKINNDIIISFDSYELSQLKSMNRLSNVSSIICCISLFISVISFIIYKRIEMNNK